MKDVQDLYIYTSKNIYCYINDDGVPLTSLDVPVKDGLPANAILLLPKLK